MVRLRVVDQDGRSPAERAEALHRARDTPAARERLASIVEKLGEAQARVEALFGEGSDPVSNAVDGQAYITGAVDAQKEVVKEGATSGAAETEKKATAGVVSRGSMNLESDEEEDEEESTWEREAKLKRVSVFLNSSMTLAM